MHSAFAMAPGLSDEVVHRTEREKGPFAAQQGLAALDGLAREAVAFLF